ncbi:hypothetical protein HB780_02395 (plasmid) [Rhizobium lusitanum]|uniref:hypothetical protein n=1 Tax=Rhizobium lusitanum TaxID=293958 RepID=UPI00161A6AFF|nr:hypothetical protein [Rhizobium lusitanum]QND44655.1 hypothetical protein HB780_02395 [Rhizobium lusitanum]
MRQDTGWIKLVAGLHIDGFEIVETEVRVPARRSWRTDEVEIVRSLSKIYPVDVPALDFNEAESEIALLLDRHSLVTTKGHLRQAIQNFTNGNRAVVNS